MKSYLNSTRISLMLSDVDGTLVTNDKVVTPRARAAVAELRAAHIGFTITSGRPPRGMKMLIDDLKIDTVVAGFNGGVFVNPDLTVIQSRFIPRAVAARALEVIGQHKLVGWLYTETDWFVPDAHGAHVAREASTVNFEAKVSSDFSPLLGRAVKIVDVSDDLKGVAECEAVLQSELLGQASVARSQSYYLAAKCQVMGVTSSVRKSFEPVMIGARQISLQRPIRTELAVFAVKADAHLARLTYARRTRRPSPDTWPT